MVYFQLPATATEFAGFVIHVGALGVARKDSPFYGRWYMCSPRFDLCDLCDLCPAGEQGSSAWERPA